MEITLLHSDLQKALELVGRISTKHVTLPVLQCVRIEAKENEYVIRYRVDGSLKEVMRLRKKIGISLVSRYKVMSKLDISNKRKPQDGKFTVNLPNSKFDVRVSTLPSIHGEKIVLRILGGTVFGRELSLSNLSLRSEIYDGLSEALNEPNGIVFVTGPTVFSIELPKAFNF